MAAIFTIRAKRINRRASLLCGFILLIGVGCGTLGARAETEAEANKARIAQKQAEIRVLQAQISAYQAQTDAYRKASKSLKNEIAAYESEIGKNGLEVRETKALIEAAELEIFEAEKTIRADDESIVESKAAMRELIRELYGYQQTSVLEILMDRGTLSEFFNEVGAMETVEMKTMELLGQLRQQKADLTARSAELEIKQEQQVQLIEMLEAQNDSLVGMKAQKDELLRETDGEEGRYQALVSDNRKLLPSLQAELRDLQSLGSDIKFDDAISAARYIGGVTGVRPALLLAILRVESGLGTNVGGGRYAVDMNPKQRPTFEAICAELGYDPSAMPCSKKPKSYSGWGGAIGPAQMMPTTWMGTRAAVAPLVKKAVPDPWNLTDAIAAIAVKLAQTAGVTAHDRNGEYEAAGIYLAGTNWKNYTFYPDKVMYYADLYVKELGE